jgi:hypothetical protein
MFYHHNWDQYNRDCYYKSVQSFIKYIFIIKWIPLSDTSLISDVSPLSRGYIHNFDIKIENILKILVIIISNIDGC